MFVSLLAFGISATSWFHIVDNMPNESSNRTLVNVSDVVAFQSTDFKDTEIVDILIDCRDPVVIDMAQFAGVKHIKISGGKIVLDNSQFTKIERISLQNVDASVVGMELAIQKLDLINTMIAVSHVKVGKLTCDLKSIKQIDVIDAEVTKLITRGSSGKILAGSLQYNLPSDEIPTGPVNYSEKSLEMHRMWAGKLEVVSRARINNKYDLSLAYTPGVAAPCLAINQNINKSYELTRRWNTVAVITDGTAVLGLGDIGPEAGMPVMEGKSVLFKEFGGVDAIPLCVRSKSVDEIVQTVSLLLGSFGGVNLEDISAPRCFEIERRLKAISDIPIFHDDQHGTAIVVMAGLMNALKIVGKEMSQIKVVVNGAGAAGTAITRLLLSTGLKNVIMCDRTGAIYDGRPDLARNAEKASIAKVTNFEKKQGQLKDVIVGADVFIGVSAAGAVTQDMVRSMSDNAILFTLANPVPEIMPDLAKEAGAAVIGTGRSDFPNQINNVLAFPGIFRGALDAHASDINDEMKIAAAKAIAQLVSENELNPDYILPPPFDKRVKDAVSQAVFDAARESGVSRNFA